jgi:hypothetical protein
MSQLEFRWNKEAHRNQFWDKDNGCLKTELLPDKALVDNPNDLYETLHALCRVVSELMEIEERRSNGK